MNEMAYIEDPVEASGIIGFPVDGPVYKDIREDEDGCSVAVPVFRTKEDRRGHTQKGWRFFLLKGRKRG